MIKTFSYLLLAISLSLVLFSSCALFRPQAPVYVTHTDTTIITPERIIHVNNVVTKLDTVTQYDTVVKTTIGKPDTVYITKTLWIRPEITGDSIQVQWLSNTVARVRFKCPEVKNTYPKANVQIVAPKQEADELTFWQAVKSWTIWLPALVVGFILGLIIKR